MTAVFALMISAVALFPAQKDTLGPEELLAWFPVETYFSVAHWDRAALQAAESYPLYKIHFEDPIEVKVEHEGESRTRKLPGIKRVAWGRLPPSLDDKYTSSTFAVLRRDRIVVRPEGHEDYDWYDEQQARIGTQVSSIEVGGEKIYIITAGDHLYVFRFDDLDSLVKQALVNGEISTTGETAFERPIYQFVETDYADREWGRVAYATVTQELLVADKLENLRAMIAAGHGTEMDLLSEPENAPLLRHLPDLGQIWTVRFLRQGYELTVKLLRERGADEKTLAPWEERAENGVRIYIESWELGNNIVEKNLSVCGSRDYTERLMGNQKMYMHPPSSGTPEWLEYQAIINEATKFEIEGTTLIQTTTYDEEVLDARRKADVAEMKRSLKRALQKQRK